MKYTIFDTPVLNTFFKVLAHLLLYISGWKKEGKVPDSNKYILVAAPHTSNWDLYYTLLIAFSFNIKIYWMGKDSLFKKGPAGCVMRWLGGIPVDRSKSNNLVSQIVDRFDRSEDLKIVISPAGTRSKSKKWRTGFYYMALGAQIPVVLGFVDFKRKVGGLGPAIDLTGDIDRDMGEIKDFYRNVTGKYPEKQLDHN